MRRRFPGRTRGAQEDVVDASLSLRLRRGDRLLDLVRDHRVDYKLRAGVDGDPGRLRGWEGGPEGLSRLGWPALPDSRGYADLFFDYHELSASVDQSCHTECRERGKERTRKQAAVSSGAHD